MHASSWPAACLPEPPPLRDGRLRVLNNPLTSQTECGYCLRAAVDACLELAGGWGAYQNRLLCVMAPAVAISSAHCMAPIFLVPRIEQSWHLASRQLGFLSSVFFVGYFVGVFLWASVSDAHGRRPATLMAFALGNICGIASFLAPGFTTLYGPAQRTTPSERSGAALYEHQPCL